MIKYVTYVSFNGSLLLIGDHWICDRVWSAPGEYRCHDTWEEAHAYLMRRAEMSIVNAKMQLGRAQDRYEAVMAMKKPEERKE